LTRGTDWIALTGRIEELIEELLRGQGTLMHDNQTVESLAQRYAAQLIAQRSRDDAARSTATDSRSPDQGGTKETLERFQEVDLSTLALVRPRTVGVEHAALSALRDLGFDNKLKQLGFNTPQIAASLGNIIGRMAAPASEHATHTWLQCNAAQLWEN
jgi:hypothetical protein